MRYIVERKAVLLIQIVIVYGRSQALAVEIAFAKVILEHLRPRVAGAESESELVHAALGFDDQRIVIPVAKARPNHEDVLELRERTQQLPHSRGRTSSERTRFGNSEERIGNALLKLRAHRQILIRQLVDVDRRGIRSADRQLQRLASDITDRENHISRQFVLNVHGVLVNVSMLVVLIDERDAVSDVLQKSFAAARRLLKPAREWIGQIIRRR